MSKALFYPLSNDEWLQAWDELKPAEIKILYHIRSLSPFGDRQLSIGVTDLAQRLKMNKSTVSRALKRLDELSYISLQIETAIVQLKSKSLSVDNSVVCGSTALSVDNSVVCRQQERSVGNDRLSKVSSSLDSGVSKTLKTLKDSSIQEAGLESESEKVGNSIDSEPIAQSSKLETEPQAIEPYQSSVPVNSNPETKQTNLDGAKYSATAQISSKDEKYSSAHRQEKLFEPIAPWRDSRRQLLPEFVEWLGKQFPDDGRMGQAAKARSFILNCEQGRQSIEKLEGFWDDYQAEQRKREEADRLRRESIATPVEATEEPKEPGVLTMTPEVQRIFAETNEKLKNRKRWNLKYAG